MVDTSLFYQSTQPGVISFPNLLEAKPFKGKNGKAIGEDKYSLNWEIPADHVDLAPLKALCIGAAKKKWGAGVVLATLSFPFSSGDKLADKKKVEKADGSDPRGFSRGKVVIAARSQFPPALCAVVNGALKDFDGDTRPTAKPYFYNGVEGLVEFEANAYDGVGNDGKPGVNLYLKKVCSLNKGTKLSGGASAAETFKGYVGLKSEVDPTAGMNTDDEIAY